MSRKINPSHYLLYDWLAPLYDLGIWLLALLAGGEGRLRAPVLKGLEGKGERVLEIFAGTATLGLAAAQKGARVTAVDITGGMLRVAKEKAVRSGLDVAFVRADAALLPFKDGAFDRVIVSLGLHETPAGNVPLIFKEAARVLADGGRFSIFDFYKAEGVTAALQSLFFTFFEGETAKAWVRLDLQRLLSDAGFKSFRRSFLADKAFQFITVEKN
ncbi:MAG: class I SAM-dependent methyltransferase [Deltaproteobacteria bacterium]|nr:class I SAM-dependent methyltransferase [Deltaproteobacteria bacterium]